MSSSSSAVVLAGIAVAISIGHLTWAALSTDPESPPIASESREPGPTAPSSEAECRCDDLALRRELSEVRDELTALRAQTARAALASDSPELPKLRPPSKPAPHELAAALPGDRPLPKIQLFMGIPDGVKLSQREDGTLDVEAIDPATSGEHYIVYVIVEGGTTEIVEFTVP